MQSNDRDMDLNRGIADERELAKRQRQAGLAFQEYVDGLQHDPKGCGDARQAYVDANATARLGRCD